MQGLRGWRQIACAAAAAFAIALAGLHAWGDNETPAWSPDGNRLAFATTRSIASAGRWSTRASAVSAVASLLVR